MTARIGRSLTKIRLQILRWRTKWRPCKAMAVSQAFIFRFKCYSILYFAVCSFYAGLSCFRRQRNKHQSAKNCVRYAEQVDEMVSMKTVIANLAICVRSVQGKFLRSVFLLRDPGKFCRAGGFELAHRPFNLRHTDSAMQSSMTKRSCRQ